MAIELPKGTRDIQPSKKIVRDRITTTISTIFQRYGFLPLETPSFERIDVLASKFTGGEEILKEIFTFQDQGKRDLGLRYDLTVPFARYIAMNPTQKMPFKRYAIGRVYRDGPIKKGRLREFYQCDCDIVGSKSSLADATTIMVASDVFKALQLPVTLKINNRKLLNGIMLEAGITKEKIPTTILSLDKLAKMGREYVSEELMEKGIAQESIDQIFQKIENNDISTYKLSNEEGQEGITALKELFTLLDAAGVTYEFDPTLARGLAYYTDMVVEGFLKEGLTGVAVCGGGRYDGMIQELLDSKQEYPAVGISFGLEVISEVISEDKCTTTQVYLAPVGDTLKETIALAQELRNAGINIDMDMNSRGISKNLQFANAYNIPYVLVVGGDELQKNAFQLKDMQSGEQKELSKEEIISFFRKDL